MINSTRQLSFERVKLPGLDLLQQISLQTFREAYADLNDPEQFQQYMDKAFAPAQLREELLQADTYFYFALMNGQLVGYLKVNLFHGVLELPAASSMELERIYLKKNFWHRHLGKELLAKAIELAQGFRMSTIWLGVWHENPRAIRFYQKHGFEIFGEHDFYMGTERQKDWLMKRSTKSIF